MEDYYCATSETLVQWDFDSFSVEKRSSTCFVTSDTLEQWDVSNKVVVSSQLSSHCYTLWCGISSEYSYGSLPFLESSQPL